MSILSRFKNFSKQDASHENDLWRASLDELGIHISRSENLGGQLLPLPTLSGLLTQLLDDQFIQKIENSEAPREDYLFGWDSFYEALSFPGYEQLQEALLLPNFTNLVPALSSRGAITDSDFSISLGAWRDELGKVFSPIYVGPVLKFGSKSELMTLPQWELVMRVTAFAKRQDEARTDQSQRQDWGHIRRVAVAAKAHMSDFLVKTVVLTPERLDINFRKSDVAINDTIVEVIPGFDGVPNGWLDQFDRFDTILDRYDLALDDGGLVQIVLSPEVKAVLQQIKRFPGRRMAGSRAQAFLLNPFATLGDAATAVIDETQFEKAREDAGLRFERFSPIIEYDALGFTKKVGILIESASSTGPIDSKTQFFVESELRNFIACVEQSIERGFQLVLWEGNELEILGETPDHLVQLKEALEKRMELRQLVTYADVYDLTHYSSRIEGVGIEKPIYSPFISRTKSDEGWFPENVETMIVYTPEGEAEPLAVAVNSNALEELREATSSAKEQGKTSVEVPWLPSPISIAEASNIAGTFDEVLDDVKAKKFDPKKAKPSKPIQRKTLILKDNINTIEYEENRRQAMNSSIGKPRISSALSSMHELLEHQLEGVAKLQHLYGLRNEFKVRGMLLGDDMGLGKTLQLLSLMVSIVEEDPQAKPMLVVAPVSLLENWKEEADKFFPGSLRILTAYGANLKPLRVPRESIDSRLLNEDGLVRFLLPNWVGNAQLVLTTYETMRDLEFSFSNQQWSLMVCDEAQRIKNPAAMVSRAAKKQQAEFKIACTGTPVENTLADLWCLFDYVQPGLLGALNDFGRRYRRPIEIDERDEEGKERIEQLRNLIEPQLLRRTKLEVIKNLPKKIVDQSCRNLPISNIQRNLYARSIEDFKKRADPNFRTPFKNHLGLLHYLRLICTDPRRHGLTVFKPEPIDQYRANAPKMDWLLKVLGKIKVKEEKVIIFCEFRQIQRLLSYYIEQTFGFEVDIINGDTSASSNHAASRQKRIKSFQAKAGFGVIILSPVAVGFGVNIQGANHVIHYTRTWNPAKEDQASDRAWRIGQKKDVYVYYPVVSADDFTTFDVKLNELLESKRSLAGDMLNGSPDISLGDFKLEDVVPSSDADSINERVTIDVAMRMEWRHFEGLAAALWAKRGFDTVYCTPGSNDNGVDVVSINKGRGELVQAKTSSLDGKSLSWDVVKEVVAGEAFYRRRHPGVEFKKVGLTNQYFNSQAHENAILNGVELIDQQKLKEMLIEHKVMMLDVERYIYTQWSDADTEIIN